MTVVLVTSLKWKSQYAVGDHVLLVTFQLWVTCKRFVIVLTAVC